MNRIQREIYTWLSKKKGYLKKSAEFIKNRYKSDCKLSDVIIALNQAKIDSKGIKGDFPIYRTFLKIRAEKCEFAAPEKNFGKTV